MKSLGEFRRAYSHALVLLLVQLPDLGYEFAFDEVTDHVTEKDPTTDHMKGSLHEIGLAADILLYKNGVYLEKTEDYEFLGTKWEALGISLGLPLVWGGRFTKHDGNHFSISYAGKA